MLQVFSKVSVLLQSLAVLPEQRVIQVDCPSRRKQTQRNNGAAVSAQVKPQLCSLRQENADRLKETRAQAKQRRDKLERLTGEMMKLSKEAVSDLKFE